ncbi:hypothetical protein Sjap_001750 [Stephania japonica]|uniref:Uncharacterized protein n=1 Tax=Stephania japonica TaxID=461633 RepID=A0AAP0PTK2_9MAGN
MALALRMDVYCTSEFSLQNFKPHVRLFCFTSFYFQYNWPQIEAHIFAYQWAQSMVSKPSFQPSVLTINSCFGKSISGIMDLVKKLRFEKVMVLTSV